jgi:hypothetical protein
VNVGACPLHSSVSAQYTLRPTRFSVIFATRVLSAGSRATANSASSRAFLAQRREK